MKRTLFFLLTLLLCLPASAQLLYRISGNGLTKDSYIIGTYHLADGSIVDSIPGCRTALNSSEQVCGELPFADMFHPDSVAVLQQKMFLPEGQTLKDVLTEDQFRRVSDCYKSVVGVGLDNPMMFSQAGRMSPTTLGTSIALLRFMQLDKHPLDPQNTLDNYFQKEALNANKPVLGFETLSFQADVIYGVSIEEQVRSLMNLVDSLDTSTANMSEIVNAYYAQDFDKLTEVAFLEMQADSPEDAEYIERIVYRRNENWIKQMPEIMADKSTFFAVGAAHLGTERGVLNLLRQAGYQVDAITSDK